MSEEIVNYSDIAVSNRQTGRIVLAGWPTERVVQIEQLLRLVVPRSTVDIERGETRLSPFAERISKPRNPSDVDSIRREISLDEQSILLIFIQELPSVLAAELSKSSSIDLDIARDWQAGTDRLLAMADPQDAKIKVISMDDVFAAPNAFVEYLSETFDLPLCYANTPQVPTVNKWDDFYLLIAEQYINGQRDLRSLDDDLAARRSFMPLSTTGESARIDWSAVLHDVGALRTENGALLEMLHRVQLEFEDTMADLGRKEDQLKQLTGDLKEKEGELARRDKLISERDIALIERGKSLKTASQELQRVKTTAADLRSKLDAERIDRRNVAEKLRSTRVARDRAQSSIKAVHDSTSWKVTAPIRNIVSRLRG